MRKNKSISHPTSLPEEELRELSINDQSTEVWTNNGGKWDIQPWKHLPGSHSSPAPAQRQRFLCGTPGNRQSNSLKVRKLSFTKVAQLSRNHSRRSND